MAERLPAIVVLAAIAFVVTVAAGTSDARDAAAPVRLADATMIIEVNATDGDAGLQAFLDGEPWSRMAVFGPGGRRVLDVKAEGRLGRLGMTELFSESNEPDFSELSLRRFKRRFPAGTYMFAGTTVDGKRIVGRTRLSHHTPNGPRIASPAAGATVPEDDVVARWAAGDQPAGVEITGYRVIVERERPLRVFQVELPASVTSIRIPAEYLDPDTEYKLELQAIDKSGNQTISELRFATRALARR
jgi:hypothetical protein